MITQEEYNMVKQVNRDLSIKIELLNYKFQTVDELSGVVIGTPSFTVNADSDIRRTCSLSLIPKDSSFDIKNGNKIWMDKYVRIFIGINNNMTNEVIYSKQGIYMIHNPNHIYNATNNSIDIQGIDLMAKLTGLRNGNLDGVEYVILEDSDVRLAVIDLLKIAGFNNYIISDYPIKTPYEIKVGRSSNIYEILRQLRDILPNYQMYFDLDGVFHFEEIPSGKDEQIFIDDDIWKSTLISYSKGNDYTQVKNVIRVFGKMHDITNFANESEIVNDTYKIKLPNVISLRDYLKVGFITKKAIKNPKLQINDLPVYPILNENKTVPILEDGEQYYVVKFKKDYFEFMGDIEPYGIAKEENPNSPFYIKGALGEIPITLEGGEYDNIFTNQLAQERANWELYSRCKLKDSVSLECIPIYWADVNKIISITLPNKTGDEETNLYIIKSINTTFGVTGTQSIQCMRYYPFYSDYVKNEKGE